MDDYEDDNKAIRKAAEAAIRRSVERAVGSKVVAIPPRLTLHAMRLVELNALCAEIGNKVPFSGKQPALDFLASRGR